MTYSIYISTINTIENKYMKNCHPDYIEHWVEVRARMFRELLEMQIREFDKS